MSDRNVIDAAKKGSAEILILALMERRSLHGYEIGRQIEEQSGGTLRFTLASLYAPLSRMEDRAWLRPRAPASARCRAPVPSRAPAAPAPPPLLVRGCSSARRLWSVSASSRSAPPPPLPPPPPPRAGGFQAPPAFGHVLPAGAPPSFVS